jgi:hypothetical protein
MMVGLLLAGLVCCQEASALRQSSDSPPFPQERNRWPNARERGIYQAKIASTGKSLWEVHWETRVLQDRDQLWVEVTEEGQGQPWRYKEPILWEKRMRFSPEPMMRVYSVQGSRWSMEGQLLSQMDLEADPAKKRILYKDREIDGSIQETTAPWGSDVLPDELLFHWVRTLAFDPAPAQEGIRSLAGECLLLVSPSRRFRMRAFLSGTEQVATPAGTFSCFRVELTPHLGMLKFLPVKGMIPKILLWCTTAPPHHWVRYEGPVGGPGSPQAVIELTRFEQVNEDAPSLRSVRADF